MVGTIVDVIMIVAVVMVVVMVVVAANNLLFLAKEINRETLFK